MRTIITVITQIIAALPQPAPREVEENLLTLHAELKILARTAEYYPPEADVKELWQRLGIMLYRYLPNAAGYAWAMVI